MLNKTLVHISAAMVILTIVLSACSVNPVTGKSDFVMMSEKQEIKLGRDAHADIAKQYGGVYDDPALQEYVQRIGEKLATHSHRSNLVYRFTVLDSPMVNAFALPGGYIYITRGLLAYLNSEAEMAAVLGHEIGHVTARHSVRQISAAQAADLGYRIGAILVPELGSQLGQNLFNIIGGALISGYGREHELESDRLGAEYLARSGYDPQAMVDVIGVLKNQEEFDKQLAEEEGREPRVYHGVFASHPSNDQRLQEVVASADAFKGDAVLSNKRDEFLQQLDAVVFGEGAQQGIVRLNKFYHKDLGIAFEFPLEWQIENLPDRLVARSRPGDAVLQVATEDLNKHISPREFMQTRLKLKKLRDGKEIKPGGLEAYTAWAKANTPFGNQDARFSVIYHANRAYIFIAAINNAESFDRYDQAILKSIDSFHGLTEEEAPLADPLRIKITRADKDMHYEMLAKHSAISHHAEEQLRLLNAAYPDGEPAAGQWIKTVE